MQLSVIIINFNTFQLTCECIQSIKQHIQSLSYEIILVDNAPKKDMKADFLQAFPQLVYLRSEENIGFGSANNLGMQVARGKYFLLINSDTIVLDESLEQCVAYMEADQEEQIGVLGCQLLNEDLSFQPSFYPFRKNSITNYLLTNNWILNKLLNINRRFQQTMQTMEVGDVSGAFMLLRKKVVDEVGPFDPDFFLYCEETEWCRERIAKHFKIIYYPEAAIIHLGGKSAPREPMYVQSKLSLALLWYKKGWANYILYLFFSHLNLLVHAFLLPFVHKDSRTIIKADIRSSLKVLPYLVTEVNRYRRGWGCREEPLIYKGARPIFFENIKTADIQKLPSRQ